MSIDGRPSPERVHGDRSKKVFVVHGRNLEARSAMFDFLRSLGLRPIEFAQARRLTGEGTPYIATILDAAFEAAQAVVVLFTPDELVRLRGEYAVGVSDPDVATDVQPRANVLFEAGIAMGRDPSRTILVELGRMRPFTDIVGRHAIRMSNGSDARHQLAERLESAGCDVDRSGVDWLESGNFSTPPEFRTPTRSERDGGAGHSPPVTGEVRRRRWVR